MNPFIVAPNRITLIEPAEFAWKAGMWAAAIKVVIAKPLGLPSLFAIVTNKYAFPGFLLYGLGAIVGLWGLSKFYANMAYALVGTGFMGGEGVTFNRVAGVALICAGVFMARRS